MRYEQVTIDKIHQHTLLEVADALGLRYRGTQKYRACHCFMHEDKHPSMWLNTGNNIWFCPVCNKGGDIIRLVQLHEDLSCEEAIGWLIRHFSIVVPEDRDRTFQPLRRHASAPSGHSLPTPARPVQYLDAEWLERSTLSPSDFGTLMTGNFPLDAETVGRVCRLYRLGRERNGGVIFWQIDEQQRVHDGKIMYYRPDCHRDHDRHPTWVSHCLKRLEKLPADWQTQQCLFGLHLLSPEQHPAPADESQQEMLPVAVVESEKTALLCACKFPHYLWMATGGLSCLTVDRLRPLKGRKVVLFPDTDTAGHAYRLWLETAHEASKVLGQSIYVSNVLELLATVDQRERKIDIADYLFEK